MHTRQLIRESAERQVNKVPGIKFTDIGRRKRLDELKQLPAAIIYTDNESQEQISQRPRCFLHTVELRVAYYVKDVAGGKADNELDNLAEAADPLVIDGLTALDVVRRVVPTEWEVDGDGAADSDYLTAVRLYLVEYDSQEP